MISHTFWGECHFKHVLQKKNIEDSASLFVLTPTYLSVHLRTLFLHGQLTYRRPPEARMYCKYQPFVSNFAAVFSIISHWVIAYTLQPKKFNFLAILGPEVGGYTF
jgi:hypothetical protein